MTTLGSARHPDCILYLPNPPQWDDHQPLDLAALIAANGNHWRKILTIFAKLRSPDGDWRAYRDQQLLKSTELISFEDRLTDAPQAIHLIAGKASWERLGLKSRAFEPLDGDRLYQQGRIFLTPYPDYRQFPNQLIDTLRPLMT